MHITKFLVNPWMKRGEGPDLKSTTLYKSTYIAYAQRKYMGREGKILLLIKMFRGMQKQNSVSLSTANSWYRRNRRAGTKAQWKPRTFTPFWSWRGYCRLLHDHFIQMLTHCCKITLSSRQDGGKPISWRIRGVGKLTEQKFAVILPCFGAPSENIAQFQVQPTNTKIIWTVLVLKSKSSILISLIAYILMYLNTKISYQLW